MRKGLLLLLLLPALSHATPVPLSTGEIEASTDNAYIAPEGGSAPVWIEVHNKGARPRTLEVRFSPFRSEGRVTRAVALEPGERRTVSLPVPWVLRFGEVQLRSEKGELLGSEQIGISPNQDTSTLLVLGTEAQLSEVTSGLSLGQSTQSQFLAPRRMPDLLSGYKGFRAVVLLEPLDTLERGQRAAIEQYVLTGGILVVKTEALDSPIALDTWRGSAESTRRLGFGAVRACVDLTTCNRALAVPVTNDDLKGTVPDRMLAGVGEPPLGTFLVIIVLFALAIGPGNLLLARRYGRHLMLVTIPAFALTTCTGIAGYGVASDGLFTVHEESRGATILDEANKRATTIGAVGLYAALAPSEVRYPASTAVHFEDLRDLVAVDWSEGLTFRSGFVPSRSYRSREIVTVAPTRARLSLQGGKVQNGLGAAIRGGVAFQGKHLLHFENVAEGGEAPAERTGADKATDEVQRQAQALLAGHLSQVEIKRATEALKDGEFLVILENDAGFVPDGGLKPERRPSPHVVRGRLSP